MDLQSRQGKQYMALASYKGANKKVSWWPVVDYTDENGNEQKDHCFSGIRRSFKSVYESVMTGEDAGATGAAAGGAASGEAMLKKKRPTLLGGIVVTKKKEPPPQPIAAGGGGLGLLVGWVEAGVDVVGSAPQRQERWRDAG